jgi:outer membrane protein TolC
MVRMLAVICCLVCGLFLWGAAAPATAQAPVAKLTLDEAVSLARAVNPTVRAKEFEVEAVGANEITAGLRPNPVATFLAEQFGGGSAALTQYTFKVGQPIELGGKRQRRIDSAKAATKVTGYELIDLRRQIIFQVKRSFTDILGPDNTIGFGFALPIRLFDRNQGEIARARAEAKRVEATREALLAQVPAEVDTALAAVKAEREKAVLLRDTYLPKIKQARETIDFAYRRGGVNLLDYLDAQRTYREKSLEYLRSLVNYRTAVYALEAAVGGQPEN